MQSVHITVNVVSSNPAHVKMYSIQHYVIKFVSNVRQIDAFLSTYSDKTDLHDIAEILLNLLKRLNPSHLSCMR